jgi:hypothetical protein
MRGQREPWPGACAAQAAGQALAAQAETVRRGQQHEGAVAQQRARVGEQPAQAAVHLGQRAPAQVADDQSVERDRRGAVQVVERDHLDVRPAMRPHSLREFVGAAAVGGQHAHARAALGQRGDRRPAVVEAHHRAAAQRAHEQLPALLPRRGVAQLGRLRDHRLDRRGERGRGHQTKIPGKVMRAMNRGCGM